MRMPTLITCDCGETINADREKPCKKCKSHYCENCMTEGVCKNCRKPKKTMKLTQFEQRPLKNCCEVCDCGTNQICTIRLTTYDATKPYENSQRPFINNYKCRCCPICFKRITENILNTVYEK